ncbi:MAG TPA: DUF4349 domain-containing protein [Oscillospiraceae bacterium]|nr:DUF4349 domain-containing protein [Oscillospiraceae bacterium]
MTKKQFLGFLVVILLILAGCSAGRGTSDNAVGEGGMAGAPEENFGKEAQERADADGSLGEAEQKLIRTASLLLDVEVLDDAIETVSVIVKGVDGFIAKSNVYGAAENRSAELTLRLPAQQLDAVLDEIKTMGTVRRSSTGSNDVTLQYVDLEARIRNLSRQEERLLDVLAQASTVEDILRVEQELARIRGELEAHTAEFRYLKDRVDYATADVFLYETSTASSTITTTGLTGVWQRGSTGFIKSINAMLTGLGNLLVFLFTSLPYLSIFALIGVPIFLLVRKFMANRSRS